MSALHRCPAPSTRRRLVCLGVLCTLILATGPQAEAQKQQKPPPDAKKSTAKPAVDLLPLIDPAKDAVKGKWGVADKVLFCNDQHFAPRVQIPYEPPDEYDFIIQFSQPKLRHAVTAIMPNRHGGSFLWKVGVRDGSDFELLAKPAKQGKAPRILKPNTYHTTVVQVRRNSVRCLLDGKDLFFRQTDFKDLTIDGWHKIQDDRLLGLGCDDPTLFYTVRVVEVSGPGKLTRPPQ